MIQLYIFLTLASIGYLFTKTSTVPKDNRMLLHRSDVPSMDTIYDSSFYNKVKEMETANATRSFSRSHQENPSVINSTYREQQDAAKLQRSTVKSMLAGVEIPADQFTHNNQTPFFGSKVRQNLDPSANAVVMERFTGNFSDDVWKKKNESKPFFKPSREVNHVNGVPVQVDSLIDRYQPGVVRNNERPFEPELVGPGLNSGYSSQPVGGFQQFERDSFMPKNVDDLRVLTNPKSSYKGRVLPGAGIGQRGKLGRVDKNRADTFYENDEARYFTTTGVEIKPREREDYDVKYTHRTDTTEPYMGDAYNAVKSQRVNPLVKDSSRQQLEDFGFRNVALDHVGKDSFDYGKESFDLPPNERDVTEERTYEGNLTAQVKALTAPMEDFFKNTRKEYTIQHPRQYGQLQPQFPDKITVKDPNDVARTTIKETNIHDSSTGNLRGPNKSIVYDPDDITRTTVRETNGAVATALNLSGGTFKSTVYNPDDKTRTTHKETLIYQKRSGNLERGESKNGGYQVFEADPRTTQKEYLSNNDYYGVATYTNADGYIVADATVPTTQKEHLSNRQHYGVAGATEYKAQMSQEVLENTTSNVLKEGTLKGRAPTAQGAKKAVNGDDINLDIRKIEEDYLNKRQTSNRDNITNTHLPTNAFEFTKDPVSLDNKQVDRLDVAQIQALNTNPYTLPSFQSIAAS